MKFFKALLYFFGTLVCLMILLLLVAIAPVDRTPAKNFPEYRQMMSRLDGLQIDIPNARKQFATGYSKINLTPAQPTATAGYAKRRGKPYNLIHDSVYVRTLVIDNGAQRVAIVSADLLIIPPTVVEILKYKLPDIGFSLDNTYLGATHSHNSIGNWGEGAASLIYGSYEDDVVNFIASSILKSIEQASQRVSPSEIFSGTVSIPEAVENRLIDHGPEDPRLRFIEVHQQDSSKLLFMTYTAHATCLYSRDYGLSRDYPGKLVDRMEQEGYEFAMFMAGAVGSHAGNAPEAGPACIDWMTNIIVSAWQKRTEPLQPVSDTVLFMKRVPLLLPDAQIKLTQGWKARSWLFNVAFGEYPVDLTVLRIGDITLLGTPCDFSGELTAKLDQFAESRQTPLMVTSFNGGYIGYVTPEKYYDVNHYETQLMNWYPPGTGEYLSDCMARLIATVDAR
jgi:hypothetical protein